MVELESEVIIEAYDGQRWALREAWTCAEAQRAAEAGRLALSARETQRVIDVVTNWQSGEVTKFVTCLGVVKKVFPGAHLVDLRGL